MKRLTYGLAALALAVALLGCARSAVPLAGHSYVAAAVRATLVGSDSDEAAVIADVTTAGDEITIWSPSSSKVRDELDGLAQMTEEVLQEKGKQDYHRIVVRDRASGVLYGSQPLRRLPAAGDVFQISKGVVVRIPKGWFGSHEANGTQLRLWTWRTDGGGTGANFQIQRRRVERLEGQAPLTGMRAVPAFQYGGARVEAQIRRSGSDGKVERDELGKAISVLEDDPASWGTVADIILVTPDGARVNAIAEYNQVPSTVASTTTDQDAVVAILRMFLSSPSDK